MFKFALLVSLSFSLSFAGISIGNKAPDFSLKSASGKEIRLTSFKGKTVVLEWLNHGCPFVKKHYGSSNMQTLQKRFTEQGVIWLSIISSAKGKQGYSTPDKALQDKNSKKSLATYVLLDTEGEVGRLYGAKVTPHMFIINKKGELVYNGAIDSVASTDQSDIKNAKPLFADALSAILENREVKIKESKPYGCSVKY